ncbi:MAG: hypothetical protein K2X91_09520 [Thermoleophilia bacterium]|nr:hypothetical protein [Thermoleophilia bacterium]
MRALPYLLMLVGAVATFVKVRMSVRRANRPPPPGAPEAPAEPTEVAVQERSGVRSARTRIGPRSPS